MQLQMMGQLWSIRDPKCGPILVQQAPEIGAWWADWASRSDRVARALDFAVSSQGWIGFAMVHTPLILAVVEHHLRPAVEARQEAPEPKDDGLEPQVPPDGTRAFDPGTGQFVVWADGHWNPEEAPPSPPAAEPEAPSETVAASWPNGAQQAARDEPRAGWPPSVPAQDGAPAEPVRTDAGVVDNGPSEWDAFREAAKRANLGANRGDRGSPPGAS